ncbi:PorP/SprF family type IX secretion system membrane protein [Pararhodonellum marinum]|uniref:PorP/SprF family type IX secretion system membrane protein n=1 Tax=Pararhodonellum marinum TaxID=2755358 RepID=UPI00188F8873|nr:type IX secretion system membrane protein PorP/SprF [Pararhodonellum marinum]
MKQVFRLFFIALFWNAIAASNLHSQQLPQFSQYVFNTLHINPGYAGYKGDLFVQSSFRSQYVNFPGASKTFTVSADMADLDEKMGYGISMMSDQIGATRINQAMANYAYKVRVGQEAYLSLGVSAGATEYVLDGTMLSPDDITDETIPNFRMNMFTPNMNLGLFFHTETFFAGLSAFNVIGKKSMEREDIAVGVHDIHYYFQVGGFFPIAPQVSFKPSILVREVANNPTNYDINGMFLFLNQFWLGAAYRSSINNSGESGWNPLGDRNALAMIFEVFANNNLRLGYAYDYNLNALSNYRNNSHEISVGIYFGSRDEKPKALQCF